MAILLTAWNAAAALAAGKPVTIVPDSLEVTVDVKSNLDSFVATVQGGELSIVADAATQTIESAVYTFDWEGMKTGDRARDRAMLDWAEAKQHPKGTFILKSFEASGAGHIVKGSLEFHGVTRDVEFPVEIAPFENGFKVSGHHAIDYRDWGLKQFRRFFVFVVSPTVTVNFKFIARNPD